MLYNLLMSIFVISASVLNLLVVNDWQPSLLTKIIKMCDYVVIIASVALLIFTLIKYF